MTIGPEDRFSYGARVTFDVYKNDINTFLFQNQSFPSLIYEVDGLMPEAWGRILLKQYTSAGWGVSFECKTVDGKSYVEYITFSIY